MSVYTGLDRLASGDSIATRHLRGRVGLLAHPASVDRRLNSALTVLRGAIDREGGAEISALFGPEHGFGGEAQDMIGVGTTRSASGLPIYSLYGSTVESLTPSPEALSELDVLVIDLADVGSRYYTYVWTACLAMGAAARAGVHTLVLDRPNPLGGLRVEGAPQREGFLSFVGLYPVSVRHGMTLGEITKMVASREGIDEQAFTVVPMQDWSRALTFAETGLPWVLPSPNMPTLETAQVYPGGCLLEGTTLSEGRGLTRPFEIFGAPGLDGNALASAIELEGAILRPTTFRPTFHKHGEQICSGVQVHVVDRERFEPYAAYLRLIAGCKQLLGDAFSWRHAPYEFVDKIPAIDLLTGGDAFRRAIDEDGDLREVLANERAGATRFAEERQAWLLY